MTFTSIVVLALGLSMDATAVAAARGLSAKSIKPANALTVALLFGGAQALMPLLGFFLGAQFGRFVAAVGDWIAFFILSILGAKMIHEARKPSTTAVETNENPFAWSVLILLAVATSIDAFAAGITLFLLQAPLLLAVVTIGVTTAVLSLLGVYAGRKFGQALGKRLEFAGGLVLIGLGVKLVIDRFTGG